MRPAYIYKLNAPLSFWQLERERLRDEAEMMALARARKRAEMLAKMRGAGLRSDEWYWIDPKDVPADGPLNDPLFCHGHTYEQCNYKVHRQEFLAIEGTKVRTVLRVFPLSA